MLVSRELALIGFSPRMIWTGFWANRLFLGRKLLFLFRRRRSVDNRFLNNKAASLLNPQHRNLSRSRLGD
jgi:hypothetical protein